jgi:hypothetical protein
MTRLLSLSGLEAGLTGGQRSDRSAEFIPAPKGFLEEVARAGGGGPEVEKMLGDA